MNKLQLKITEVTDETALLLDQIYRFPQKQRERFYDRIQALKNNFAVLRSNMKQSNLTLCQKRFNQLVIEVNTLKSEIHECERDKERRRKISLHRNSINDPSYIKSSLKQKPTDLDYLSQKQKHQQTMQIIVQNQQQIQQYKAEAAQYKSQLKNYQQRQETMFEEIQQIKTDIELLNKYNIELQNQNEQLKKESKHYQTANIQLESMYSTHRDQLEMKDKEIKRLVINVRELSAQLDLKVNENLALREQLVILEEKYTYEIREFREKGECYRIKQINKDKQLADLQRKLSKLHDQTQRNHELQQQNKRVHENLAIISQQLQKQTEQCNLRESILQNKNQQLQKLKNFQEEFQKILKKKEEKLKQTSEELAQFRQNSDQSDTVIEALENKIRSLERKVGELEENCFVREKELKEMQHIVLVKEEDYRKILIKFKEIQIENERMTEEQRLKHKNEEKLRSQIKELQIRNEQLSKSISQAQKQRYHYRTQAQSCQAQSEKLQKKEKQQQKLIDTLQKKVLRAKIQAIHDIRQIIV